VRLATRLNRQEFIATLLGRSFAPPVVDLVIDSVRSSTNSQYERAWKHLQTWLLTTEASSFEERDFLAFLADLGTRVAPRTVSNYRAALKWPLQLGFHIDTSSSLAGRVIRGLALRYPKPPRILPLWSLDKVLSFLSGPRFLPSNCSMWDLTRKTIFLLSLASGNRVSELAALSRDALLFSNRDKEVTVAVRPNFRFKNQNNFVAPPNVSVKALPGVSSMARALCPVRTLRDYLAATSPSKHPDLLINSKTGNPLTTQAVSLTICHLISQADPGSIPRAHDTRKIAISLAWTRGLSPATIMSRMNLKTANSMFVHYLSSIPRPGFPSRPLDS